MSRFFSYFFAVVLGATTSALALQQVDVKFVGGKSISTTIPVSTAQSTISTWQTPVALQIGTSALQLTNANFGTYTPYSSRVGIRITNCSNGVSAGTIRVGIKSAPTTVVADAYIPQNGSITILANAATAIYLLGDNSSMDFRIAEF